MLIILLFLAVSCFAAFSATSPFSAPQIQSTPAKFTAPLTLGVASYSVSDFSDYGRFGADASFGFSNVQAGAAVEYTSLDTLYERLRTQWQVSFSRPRYGLGVGYGLDLQRELGHENWASHRLLFGAFGRAPDFLLYGALFRVPLQAGQERWSTAFSVHWVLESYRFYAEYETENGQGHSLLLGQEIMFGAWGVETSYKIPNSRFYVGINIWWGCFGVNASMQAVSKYYQGRELRLEYARKP